MRRLRWIGACLLLAVLAPPAPARLIHIGSVYDVDKLNQRLKGKVLDYTNNHGRDRRLYSPALDEKRDLYVYLPPGYDPAQQYPAMIWMHGIGQDERDFLPIAEVFDKAIGCGDLPPFVIAAPDGSIPGWVSLLNAGSFFVNSKAGRFEDYIIGDVWGFMQSHLSIRPEREAHMLAGASMGGFGAFNLGIKHRDQFKIITAMFPPVNLRYVDCHGRYSADFDPNCFGIRERLQPWAPLARFYGVIVIRQRRLVGPLYGRSPDALDNIARENPAEMLASYDLQPGELDMLIGYGAKDQFNMDAQVESFVYLAAQRGICVDTVKDPRGKHNYETGLRLFPYLIDWLGPRIAPYAPPNPCCGPRTAPSAAQRRYKF